MVANKGDCNLTFVLFQCTRSDSCIECTPDSVCYGSGWCGTRKYQYQVLHVQYKTWTYKSWRLWSKMSHRVILGLWGLFAYT